MLRLDLAPPVAFVLCALATSPALGDVIPPPDRDCPTGQVAVTDHGGTHCRIEEPKNCAPGWTGRLGGTCALHECSDDASCGDPAKVCRDFSLCFEPREVQPDCVVYPDFSYGASARSPELGMAPPRPCGPDEGPTTRWFAVNVCGGSERCASPSECRPGKLCVPRNAPAPQVMPRGPDGKVNNDPPGGRVRPGGCGSGCVGAPASSAGGVGALLALVGLVALRSRRRRSES